MSPPVRSAAHLFSEEEENVLLFCVQRFTSFYRDEEGKRTSLLCTEIYIFCMSFLVCIKSHHICCTSFLVCIYTYTKKTIYRDTQKRKIRICTIVIHTQKTCIYTYAQLNTHIEIHLKEYIYIYIYAQYRYTHKRNPRDARVPS